MLKISSFIIEKDINIMWPMIIVGAMYVALGIWCTVDPAGTSSKVGFELQGGQGRSEFITVYGGIEVGIGVAMILTGWSPQLRVGGLAFAAIVTAALVVFRLPTLFVYELPSKIYYFVVAEIVTAAWLAWAYWGVVNSTRSNPAI